MKANAPKRKVFQDAVDLISSPEVVNVVDNGQAMISVEKIVPFHNHPFRLYEGKRLEDMVESIREHGILIPVIVQKIADGYEMLSGHNRWNAAKIVGIKEIPAIIKEDLTEREAYVYVIETNMLQRSFDDLLPSEKAAVLAERYEKVMCQGRRNDILEEIAMLNGMDLSETCGHDVHKSKSRDSSLPLDLYSCLSNEPFLKNRARSNSLSSGSSVILQIIMSTSSGGSTSVNFFIISISLISKNPFSIK